MTKIQIIPGTFDITDPDWPVFDFVSRGGIYTSDTMSEDGSFVGAYSDAGLGGMAHQWLTTGDGGWEKQGGIARAISTEYAGFQVQGADHTTSVRVEGLPNPSMSITISNRRSTFGFSPSATDYIDARILNTGGVSLVDRRGGQSVVTISSAPSGTVAIGDTVALATVGTLAEVLVNGVVVASGQTSVTEPGYSLIRTTDNGTIDRTSAFSEFVISME